MPNPQGLAGTRHLLSTPTPARFTSSLRKFKHPFKIKPACPVWSDRKAKLSKTHIFGPISVTGHRNKIQSSYSLKKKKCVLGGRLAHRSKLPSSMAVSKNSSDSIGDSSLLRPGSLFSLSPSLLLSCFRLIVIGKEDIGSPVNLAKSKAERRKASDWPGSGHVPMKDPITIG